MTALLVEERSLVVVQCQLLHQEHREVGLPGNGQNILELDTDEQDVTLQMDQIEIDGTEVLEV